MKFSIVVITLIFSCLPAWASEKVTILAYGDSLSAAYGIDESQGWVSLLQNKLDEYDSNLTVINASVSGETSRGGLARFPATLEFSQADIVLLELGANDGLRGYPIESMRQNLRQMIELAQQNNAQVILIGIRLPPNLGPAYLEPFEASFGLLADEYSLPLLPFLLEGVAGNDELMQGDGLHPKAVAQPQVLENVWQVLEPVLVEQGAIAATVENEAEIAKN